MKRENMILVGAGIAAVGFLAYAHHIETQAHPQRAIDQVKLARVDVLMKAYDQQIQEAQYSEDWEAVRALRLMHPDANTKTYWQAYYQVEHAPASPTVEPVEPIYQSDPVVFMQRLIGVR